MEAEKNSEPVLLELLPEGFLLKAEQLKQTKKKQ